VSYLNQDTSVASELSWDDDNNNVFLAWSLEDDRALYEGYKTGKSIEELCLQLRRGYQGVKMRIKAINNPDNKAFLRLFGGLVGDALEESEGSLSASAKKNGDVRALRPCCDVIERILWDKSLNVDDFSFIYRDRYVCLTSFFFFIAFTYHISFIS
jgi:hypothetical protein